MKPKPQILEVWGDFACFSRPELKVERFSYPIITPSAARGIFDAIYCREGREKMLATHKQLHESAVDICRQIGGSEEDQQTAKKIFDEKTIPLLHNTLTELDSLKTESEKAIAGMKQAQTIYDTQTKASLHKVQKLLTDAGTVVKNNVGQVNQEMLASARITKNGNPHQLRKA